jgi:hypothetical protein
VKVLCQPHSALNLLASDWRLQSENCTRTPLQASTRRLFRLVESFVLCAAVIEQRAFRNTFLALKDLPACGGTCLSSKSGCAAHPVKSFCVARRLQVHLEVPLCIFRTGAKVESARRNHDPQSRMYRRYRNEPHSYQPPPTIHLDRHTIWAIKVRCARKGDSTCHPRH